MKTGLLSDHSWNPVLTARRFQPALALAIVLLACLAFRPDPAAGAVFDDFESYVVGSNLHGQGGWSGWQGDPAAGALVASSFSFSPTRSVNINGASDLVHTISGATNGQWLFRAMQYIPSTSTGTNFVVLLNTYRPPYGVPDLNWSVIIQNNLATGQVISELGGNATRPLIKDQWVEVRCEINLASNSVSEFYNGQLLSTHPWHDSNGTNQIQALDLFANNAGPAYYDNVSLAPDCVTNCCLRLSNEILACATNGAGKLNYSFNLQNGTGVPVKYLFLVPRTNCFTLTPNVIIFNPPLPPGQTTNVNVMITLSGNCPTNLCFLLSAHDPNFVECCSLTFCSPDRAHRLNWTFVNGQLCLSWVCDGVLECTTSLSPPINWVPAPNQSNPQCFTPGSDKKFFRLRQ